MSEDFLKVLQNHKLDNISELSQRLEKFSPVEWLEFSDSLDEYYSSMTMPASEKGSFSPLTFCFPSLPYSSLVDISTYVLISDKVFLDDPLYDTAAYLGAMASSSYFDFDSAGVYMLKQMKSQLTSAAVNYISYYLNAKELIQEKKLIPYKQTILPSGAREYAIMLQDISVRDTKLRRFLKLPHPLFASAYTQIKRLQYRLRRVNDSDKIASDLAQSDIIRTNWNAATEYKQLMESLAIFALYGGLQGLSIDFIKPEYAYMFRKSIEVAKHINSKLPINERLLIPTKLSLGGINVPVLQNIPVERVLDTIAIEPATFESFKTTLNQKLLNISAPAGSIEREKQIANIRETINKDIANTSILYDEIKKSFSKRFVFHVGIGMSSIIIAGVSTIGQSLNPLSLTGSIFAGAALGASVKDFAKDWLDYQRELLKLRTNENYFIWRLIKKENR